MNSSLLATGELAAAMEGLNLITGAYIDRTRYSVA
jgi:hypothetical protein